MGLIRKLTSVLLICSHLMWLSPQAFAGGCDLFGSSPSLQALPKGIRDPFNALITPLERQLETTDDTVNRLSVLAQLHETLNGILSRLGPVSIAARTLPSSFENRMTNEPLGDLPVQTVRDKNVATVLALQQIEAAQKSGDPRAITEAVNAFNRRGQVTARDLIEMLNDASTRSTSQSRHGPNPAFNFLDNLTSADRSTFRNAIHAEIKRLNRKIMGETNLQFDLVEVSPEEIAESESTVRNSFFRRFTLAIGDKLYRLKKWNDTRRENAREERQRRADEREQRQTQRQVEAQARAAAAARNAFEVDRHRHAGERRRTNSSARSNRAGTDPSLIDRVGAGITITVVGLSLLASGYIGFNIMADGLKYGFTAGHLIGGTFAGFVGIPWMWALTVYLEEAKRAAKDDEQDRW